MHETFGLRFRATFSLPELPPVRSDGPVDFDVQLAPGKRVADGFSGALAAPVVFRSDLGCGGRARSEQGRGGDVLIEYEDRALFHIDVAGRRLWCAPVEEAEPSWRRFLLDSVLARAALVHGFEGIHAGAIDSPGGAIAVSAGQAGGKSTLLAELMRCGHRLFTDDIVMLSSTECGPRAHAGPPLMNLPATLPDGSSPTVHGEVLARFDDECWVAVDRAITGTKSLAAVLLLERGVGGEVAIERLPSTPVPLMACSLRSGRERFAHRFALLAAVAETTPLYRLTAPLTATPAELGSAMSLLVERTAGAVPGP